MTVRATVAAERSGGFGVHLKSLFSESLVYGLSAIVGRLLGYLLQPYYAHHFDPAQNGIQSVVYSYIPIISIALYLGMDVAYMRNAASAGTVRNGERERAFTMSLGTVFSIGGVIAVLALVGAAWLAPVARLDVRSFRYMILIVYSDALLAVPYAHLRMGSRALRYGVMRLLFVGVSVALNLLLIGHFHWGVEAIFLANLVGNLTVLTLFLPEIVRVVQPSLLRGAPWRKLWAYALPIMPAMLAVMIVENGDRIILNYLPDAVAQAVYGMSPKDVVGVYSFNYKLGVSMLLVVQMFRMAWTPFFLQHARQAAAPLLYSRVLTGLMLICAIVFLGMVVFLPSLVLVPSVQHYIKPAYWRGMGIVPIILLGYVMSGVYAVVTAGLYIERRTAVLPWIAASGALLNVAICLIAANRWGMTGVAWATPAAYALMAVLGTWQSNRVYFVPFEWRRLAHLGTIVALLYGADRWMTSHGLSPLSTVGLMVKLSVFCGLPLLLIATGFFRHGELTVLRLLSRRLATGSA